MTKLSVVMPVYNEINTLDKIIRRVKRDKIPKELIIVDDCSADGSREYLKNLEKKALINPGKQPSSQADNQIKVFFHKKNQGKGSALRTGFEHVTGDVVVIQDADLEYDPEEYHKLLEPILDGRADVVYGSRFSGGDCHRVLFFWHYVGNKMLTTLSNIFTDLNLSDMETCYKMFKANIIRDIRIEQNRFGFEPEITAKLAREDVRIFEVGISCSGRTYSAGKKITYKDSFKALWCVLKYNLWKRLSI